MQTMHLFAGAGGGLLADLILGHEPICAVEWDAYACAVLRERSADGWFPGLEVIEGDVRLVDFSPYKGRVDCIHAGFPCTDIAICGPSVGIKGERSGLYREAIRAVDEVRPKYLFMENSPEIVGRGLGDVLADLALRGYDAEWTELGAADCWGGRTAGIDGGCLLPTPRACMWKNRKWWKRKRGFGNLEELPCVSAKWEHLTGQFISPAWLEWLMQWPIMWGERRLLATGKSRSVRRRRGKSSEAHK